MAQTAGSYIICTTPRSGSTMLCRMLAATGRAGAPDSHFHTPSRARWCAVYGVTPADHASPRDALRAVFSAARTRGSGAAGQGGPFGLRMQWPSLGYFLGQLAVLHPDQPSHTARLQQAFGSPRFIYLSREDTLAQAISRLKAEQTGLWHRAHDGTELERTAPAAAPAYEHEKIARHLTTLTQMNRGWMDWFAQNDITPLHVTYEALARDPQTTLAQILRHLDIPHDPTAPLPIATSQLADATSRAWADRFRQKTGQPH